MKVSGGYLYTFDLWRGAAVKYYFGKYVLLANKCSSFTKFSKRGLDRIRMGSTKKIRSASIAKNTAQLLKI